MFFFAIELIFFASASCLAMEGISTTALQDLREGKILVDRPDQDNADDHEIRGRAVGLIHEPIENVWATIRDYNNMAAFMPNVHESSLIGPGVISEINKRSNWERGSFEKMISTFQCDSLYGDTVYVYHDLNLPFPLADRWFLLRMVLNSERHSIDWTMVVGNMNSNHGSWELNALDGNQHETLVTYTTYSDPGILVPRFILNKGMNSTLPDLIKSVGTRTHKQFN